MKNRILSLLFSVILLGSMFGLVACESSENGEENSPSQEDQTEEVEKKSEDQTGNLDIKNNVTTVERIQNLEDIAMTFYLGNEELEAAEELFPGIDPENKYDVMEEAFRQASIIDPYDLDLKYALASLQILKKDIPEALNKYEEILNFDKNHFEAQLMHAVYSKLENDQESFEAGIKRIETIDSKKAGDYKEKIHFVDEMKDLTFETEIPNNLSENNHVFIVLGYALSDEGEIQEPLEERLKVAEKAAKTYPDSKIIVTGGVPKQGITEAEVMFDWLVENGIDEERIIKENMATDTIENALFSMDIVDREELEDVTLITSATHMRRALTLFYEANQMINNKNEVDRDFSHIVYFDYEDDEETEMTEAEELVIYRDLMRTSGIWQFPGLAR